MKVASAFITFLTINGIMAAPTASNGLTKRDYQADVLKLVNDRRAATGCPRLLSQGHVARAAQLHAEDMAKQNYFTHDSKDGRSYVDRITAQGYRSIKSGEIISMGSPARSSASAVEGWMNSSRHKAIMLDCKFVHAGVGYAHGVGGDCKCYTLAGFEDC